MEGIETMTLQAVKIVFLTLGMVAMAIWFIRVIMVGRINISNQKESLIKIIDRKKIMTKVDLVAISFEKQKILMSISGDTVKVLTSLPAVQFDRQSECQTFEVKECR